MKHLQIILLSLFCIPLFSDAQDTISTDTTNQWIFVEDDPVASMLDSLAHLTIFEQKTRTDGTKNDGVASSFIPVFPDSVYRERIAAMNDQTPFEYIYNKQVQQFIELYAFKKRALTSRILGLTRLYFPMFEEQLDKYNLPLELKYLAVIESALNPTANSRAGAKGLWQFMYGTGKVYGLKVSSYVDDRFDPYKSTVAACEHLRDLYDIYGNWSLALAAYNSGAGNVNKAIRRSGGMKSFWAIYPFLPRETRSYVPAFIAASYVMTYANEHNIQRIDPDILYYEIDTVTIREILTFEQITEMLKIPEEELIFLNPSFKQKIIPASAENPYFLRLRKEHVGNFVNNETNLYAYKTQNDLKKDSLKEIIEKHVSTTDVYYVRSGDNLGLIASRHGMSVNELKSLNNLRSTTIHPKQRLLVYTSGIRPPANTASSSAKPSSATSTNLVFHTVKNGENLGLISEKYHCSISQIKEWNNLKNSTIYPGQKLKVSHKGGTSGSSASASSGKSTNFIYYTIKSGDNLWDLAQKYDCTVSQLKSLNNFTNANKLKPGQKIKIPN